MRLLALLAILLTVASARSAPALTLHVDGPGCLRFTKDGRMLYAKSAELTVVDGRLAEKGGARVVPTILVGTSTATLNVDLDGTVSADGRLVGRLVLAVFATDPVSNEGLFNSPVRPTLANPGEGECGVVRSGSEGRVKVYGSPEPVPSVRPEPAANVTKVAPGRILVLLRDRSEVDTTTFTLGQIAEITSEGGLEEKIKGSEVGDTPPIGIERIVDRNRILARIKALGVDPTTVDLGGPERARVVRKGQQLTHDRFVEAAVRGAEMRGLVAMESAAPGPVMTVPIGELELVCESVGAGSGETSVTVGVYVDGRRFNSRTVKLKSHAAITRVKVGSTVTVHVTRGRLSIEAKGKVTKVDATSGLVTVQVADTGAVLTGSVRPDGSIEVKS